MSNTDTLSNTNNDNVTTTKPPLVPKKIQKLSIDVINRISAGEVIQRPSNALKELIENSLDAGSSNIVINVRDGGMKLLQIQDNGCGIKLEDLEIVCERFTTSKLTKFEDLRKITTFGFRGEALSSISHVSHLKILTKTQDSNCAYRACYADGKLVPATPSDKSSDPKPCAGVNGTQITAEDLFFNVPSRKKVLKNFLDEHQRVVDLIKKYAINNSSISFVLKKFGETTPDVRTPGNQTEKEVISLFYGNEVGRELREIASTNEKLEYQMKCLFTTTNYNAKKSVFILFINNRLVDCKNLKSGLEQLYTKYLPKGTHPFMFVRLNINPRNVDVNIHPTKSEVKFLYEDQIIEAIQKMMDTELNQSLNSRTFTPQLSIPDFGDGNDKKKKKKLGNEDENEKSKQQQLYPNQVVRSDSKTQTLNAFLVPIGSAHDDYSGDQQQDDENTTTTTSTTTTTNQQADENSNNNNDNSDNNQTTPNSKKRKDVEPKTKKTKEPVDKDMEEGDSATKKGLEGLKSIVNRTTNLTDTSTFINPRRKKLYKPTELTSIRDLLTSVQDRKHSGLQDFFADCVFVGCLDHSFSLAQHQTKLYIINIENISKEMIYQHTLLGFHNFDTIRFSVPLPLRPLLKTAIDSPAAGWTDTVNDESREAITDELVRVLVSNCEMLHEYFSIEIVDEHICGIPQIIDNYVPCLDNLPLFLLRLASEVNWKFEKECFENLARELSIFYKIEASYQDKIDQQQQQQQQQNNDTNNNNLNNNNQNNQGQKRNRKEWVIQHLIFPLFKRFIAPKSFSSDGTVIQITSVENLYKVFERC